MRTGKFLLMTAFLSYFLFLLAGGVRSCIGWRFAYVVFFYRYSFQSIRLIPTMLYRVLEMQLIAVTLIEKFEFSLPPQSEKTRIYRKPVGLMLPMTEGEAGAWMGLVVKLVD